MHILYTSRIISVIKQYIIYIYTRVCIYIYIRTFDLTKGNTKTRLFEQTRKGDHNNFPSALILGTGPWVPFHV